MQKGATIYVNITTDKVSLGGYRLGTVVSILDLVGKPERLNMDNVYNSRYLITCKDEHEAFFSFYSLEARIMNPA